MSDEQLLDARAVGITFSNVSTRRFAYEPLVVDPSMLASTFQRFLDQGYINFELEDRDLYDAWFELNVKGMHRQLTAR
jgi:hypothetical protein